MDPCSIDTLFSFIYRKEDFTCDIELPRLCSFCRGMGHLKNHCPQYQLPKLETLPILSKKSKILLTKVCNEIFATWQPLYQDTQDRQLVLDEVGSYLKRFYSKAHLQFFGSTCSGFAFPRSDVDICMTFVDNETGEGLDQVAIIEAMSEQLRKCELVCNIIPITSAKVPIVKFMHKSTRLEGDISLYNTLGLRNTQMLRLYCDIDERVQILGYVMKYWAKFCKIGDASRGSLSSYAYIMLIIYYLQRKEVPVLPVLQELYDKSRPKPEVIIEGWNTWFFDDLPRLKEIWPFFGKNVESVGELWLGMLRFYSETFNFQEYVISIRQLKPLTRFEKFWNVKHIAIEVSLYILSVFRKSRNLFGKPIPCVDSHDALVYFFDSKRLTTGLPPSNGRCHTCRNKGHYSNECPFKDEFAGFVKNDESMDLFSPAHAMKPNHLDVHCFNCGARGHVKRNCILNSHRRANRI